MKMHSSFGTIRPRARSWVALILFWGHKSTVLIRRITTTYKNAHGSPTRQLTSISPPPPAAQLCSSPSQSNTNTRRIPLVHLRTCLPTSRYITTSIAAWPLHSRAVRLGNTARTVAWRFGPQPGVGTMSQSAILNWRKATAWTRTGATGDKLSAYTSWRLLQ